MRCLSRLFIYEKPDYPAFPIGKGKNLMTESSGLKKKTRLSVQGFWRHLLSSTPSLSILAAYLSDCVGVVLNDFSFLEFAELC